MAISLVKKKKRRHDALSRRKHRIGQCDEIEMITAVDDILADLGAEELDCVDQRTVHPAWEKYINCIAHAEVISILQKHKQSVSKLTLTQIKHRLRVFFVSNSNTLNALKVDK